jgi:hypothetical protein
MKRSGTRWNKMNLGETVALSFVGLRLGALSFTMSRENIFLFFCLFDNVTIANKKISDNYA